MEILTGKVFLIVLCAVGLVVVRRKAAIFVSLESHLLVLVIVSWAHRGAVDLALWLSVG